MEILWIKISKLQKGAKRQHCNFDFLNKIKVRFNTVHPPIPDKISCISFFYYLGNNRYQFCKYWLPEIDQYAAMCAIRYKCSNHFCCYSFSPHLNIKILSFFHDFNLIDENSDDSSTTPVNNNNNKNSNNKWSNEHFTLILLRLLRMKLTHTHAQHK